jgi:hypothetical protein
LSNDVLAQHIFGFLHHFGTIDQMIAEPAFLPALLARPLDRHTGPIITNIASYFKDNKKTSELKSLFGQVLLPHLAGSDPIVLNQTIAELFDKTFATKDISLEISDQAFFYLLSVLKRHTSLLKTALRVLGMASVARATKVSAWAFVNNELEALRQGLLHKLYDSSSINRPYIEAVHRTIFAEMYRAGLNIEHLPKWSFDQYLTGSFYSVNGGLTAGSMLYVTAAQLDLRQAGERKKLFELARFIRNYASSFCKDFEWESYLAGRFNDQTAKDLLVLYGLDSASAHRALYGDALYSF